MHYPAQHRLLTMVFSGLGAVLCILWMFAHTVQTEQRAAGLRLTFTAPQATSLRAQWDVGMGYDSATPMLIMLPTGLNQVATVPMPPEETHSLRISLPTPEACRMLEAKWFFKSPRQEIPIPLDHFSDVAEKNPREIPRTRFLLEDTPATRAHLQWRWSWQLLAGALGLAAALTLGGWAFLGAPGVLSRLQRLTPYWRQLRHQSARWAGVTATAASLLAAIVGLLAVLRSPPFCDEGDNFVGGTILAQGGTMYRDFYSQHPPFVYHLMSLAAALGAHSTESFRLAWIFFLAALWLSIYFLYRRDFGSEFLCIIVLGYTFSSTAYLTGYVLSDGSHAFGLLIVWLECLRFQGLASTPRWRFLWLGCAIFMTIMSAAVSLYALLPLGLAFAWKEARLDAALRPRLRQLAVALALVVAPFGAFVLSYTLVGNLGAFYQQAYVFNRTVYPKFLQDYGGNPWTHYLRPPQVLATYLQTEMSRGWQGILSWQGLLSLSLACTALITLVATHWRTPVLGLCMLAFFIMSGDRGYQPYFHTQPFLVLCLGIIGVWALKPLQTGRARGWASALLCCLALVMLRQNLEGAEKTLKQSIETGAATPYDDWILRHTAAHDTVWESELTPQLYINTGRRPASRVVDLVPWFYQAYKDQILSDLATNQPKVIIMDPMRNVWGHYTHTYAPELLRYINTHYTKPPAEDRAPQNLWVRRPIPLNSDHPPTAADTPHGAPRPASSEPLKDEDSLPKRL